MWLRRHNTCNEHNSKEDRAFTRNSGRVHTFHVHRQSYYVHECLLGANDLVMYSTLVARPGCSRTARVLLLYYVMFQLQYLEP